ncbi:hypothetical protein [Nocardia salmonicida]|uniref:hypothetical protein n=1 Tax=Nocardia salmonicida TaxID=53431 RepID=UPI003631C830
MSAVVLALGVAACGGTVTGRAEPTAGIADPKLDTTTPNLASVGECTAIKEFVQHGPITVMDCGDPMANTRITEMKIVTNNQKRTVVCTDQEVTLILSGLKDGHLGVAHGCAGPNLTVGHCYVPKVNHYSYDASCAEPISIRLDRTLSGISDIVACDPPFAADDYNGQIKYGFAKSNNFIEKRTGMAYCFREK